MGVDRGLPAATVRYNLTRALEAKCSTAIVTQARMDTNSLSQSLDSVNTAISVVGEEEVRTLFVSGLPMDTKPRELYLLFRAYEGYEGSLLKVTSKNGKTASPVGFVTFSSRASAEAAKQDLQQAQASGEHQRSHPATSRAPSHRTSGFGLGWPL